MYDNQGEVDGIERNVKNVDTSLHLTSFGIRDNLVVSVGISVNEKGNKEIMEKLKDLGFRKTWRSKVGNSFRIRMEMMI